MSALRRRPAETEVPDPTPMRTRGWEPHPADVLEWMGAHPYPRAQAEELGQSA